mgnify:CR=1 FL=1
MGKVLLLLLLIGISCGVTRAACTNCDPTDYCKSNSYCSRCDGNGNCNGAGGHTLRTKCDANNYWGWWTGNCVQCENNGDCPTTSTCLKASDNHWGLCAMSSTCVSSATCTTSPYRNCVTYSSQKYCAPCELNEDCKAWYGSLSTCSSSNQCSDGCSSNTHCSGSTPKCNTSSSPKTCMCLSDGDCSGSTPYCDTDSFPPKCVECKSSSDCNSLTKAKCETYITTKKCEECDSDSDCSNFNPQKICRKSSSYSTNTCVQCTQDSHCGGSTPYCSSNVCVQCTSNSHCTLKSAPKCSSNVCVPCTTGTDCHFTPENKCLTTPSPATCVQCRTDSDCGPAAPKCNPTSHTCVACLGNTDCTAKNAAVCSSNTCVPCTGVGDCHFNPENQCLTTVVPAKCVQCRDDNDCSGTTPKCKPATNTCVTCLDSTHCTSKTAAKCSASNTCVPCTVAGDCNFNPENKCLTSPSPATCVQCRDNNDCSSTPTTPKCDSTTRTCVQCLANTDCGSKNAAFCSSNMCIPCTLSTQCHFTTEKKCLTAATPALCVQCISDSDCGSTSATPKCHPTTNTCVACLDSTHCTSRSASRCSSNACVPCTDANDCHFNPENQCLASPPPATCVQCRTDADCVLPTSRCLLSTHKCVTCLTDTDCSGSTPRCLTSTSTCVACISNSDCNSVSESKCTSNTCVPCSVTADCHFSTSPFCLTSATPKKCVQCLTNNDCSSTPLTPLCSSTNTCVQCISDSQCTSLIAPKCSSNTCVPCTADADCHFSQTPMCLTTESPAQCVQCLSNSDCSATPKSPICSSLNGCVECNSNSDCKEVTASKCEYNVCEACESDKDCHFDDTPACSSSGVCVSACDKYFTSCTSCADGRYLHESSCVTSCPSSYTENSETNTCDPGLSQAEETTKSMSSVASSGTQIASTTMALNQIKGVAGAGMLGAAMGAQMVVMCKYINISYPSNVIIFFNNSFPVTITIPGFTNPLASDAYDADSELNKIYDNGNLELFEVSQYVFDNVGDAVITLALCSLLAGFVYMIPRVRIFAYCISPKLIKMIRKGEILGSNFVLINFFSNALQVVFYSCLNLYYPTIYTPFGYVNFVGSVGFLFAVTYYQVWTIFKLREIYYEKKALAESEAQQKAEAKEEEDNEKSKNKTEKEQSANKDDQNSNPKEDEQKEPEKTAEGDENKKEEKKEEEEKIVQPHLKALHEEYKDTALAQQLYIPLSMLRTILFSMNLALLPNYPRAQPIIAMILHIFYFLYLTITKPLKKKFDFIAQIYFELCVIGVTGCVIGIAFIATSDDFESNLDLWNNLGWPIVAFNFMLILGSLVLSVVSMVELVQDIIRIIRIVRAWRKKQKLRKQKIAAEKGNSPDLKVQDLDKESPGDKTMDLSMFAATLDLTSRGLMPQQSLVRMDSEAYSPGILSIRRKLIRSKNGESDPTQLNAKQTIDREESPTRISLTTANPIQDGSLRKKVISDVKERPKRLVSQVSSISTESDITLKRGVSDVQERQQLFQNSPESTPSDATIKKEFRNIEERRRRLVPTYPDQEMRQVTNNNFEMTQAQRTETINLQTIDFSRLPSNQSQISQPTEPKFTDSSPYLKERKRLVSNITDDNSPIKTERSDGGVLLGAVSSNGSNIVRRRKIQKHVELKKDAADLKVENLDTYNNSML